MNFLRSNFKKFSMVVAFLMLLTTVLLSAHYHADANKADKENACPICQIAQNFTKGQGYSGGILLDPPSHFEILPLAFFSHVSTQKLSSVLIRGPPAPLSA